LYSLDFALPNIKFYIEIDGEQHYTDKRIVEHDKNRTDVLTNLGWSCYRIRWSEYQKLNFEEKQSIINKIKTIIEIKNKQIIYKK
jgi:very-short-patch-repair endonuclease